MWNWKRFCFGMGSTHGEESNQAEVFSSKNNVQWVLVQSRATELKQVTLCSFSLSLVNHNGCHNYNLTSSWGRNDSFQGPLHNANDWQEAFTSLDVVFARVSTSHTSLQAKKCFQLDSNLQVKRKKEKSCLNTMKSGKIFLAHENIFDFKGLKVLASDFK